MSSIGPDTRLNLSGLDRIGGQPLDDLRRQQDAGFEAAVGIDTADGARGAQTDSGEDILNASAWDATGPAERMLAGDLGFEAQLGSMDLAQAADHAADAVLDALA